MKKRVPVAHRILVRLAPINGGEATSEAGIITRGRLSKSELLREMAGQEEGTVEAIGPTAFKDFGDGSGWCKVGDKVFIVRYSGTNFIDEDTEEMFRIINDDDIYAVIQEEQ